MAETVHRHLGTPMDQMTWTEAAHRLGVGVTDLVTWARERGAFCDADLDPGLDLVPSEVADAIRGIDEEKAEPSGRRAQVFAVTSGKGGVGKTSVSVNLATALAARGRRTILVDVDLGLADVHILAGTPPRRTLSDFVAGTAELVEVIGDGPRGLKIIAGGSGVKELADLDARGRARVLDAIESLRPHCDAILLDTGAGISSNVTDFLEIADHTICVTTSSFAAIADAYGVVKVLAQRNTPRSVHMIVNRVRSPEEAEQVFRKLQGCCQRFLGFELNWLGFLPEDQNVEGAVLKRSPFCEAFPTSVAARYLQKLATSLEGYLAPMPSPLG
ncbi:MAG: MinD/ParA family protein [Planctomycetota bacterium]|nr:MinD/ParA family protein [Planctomycetota bacterium]